MSEMFTIVEMENSPLKWKVEWRGMGVVTRDTSKKKLLDAAFNTGTQRIGLTSELGLHSVDFAVFYQVEDSVDIFISSLPNLSGVSFDSKEHAEKFIEDMEKRVSWNLLKREYVS